MKRLEWLKSKGFIGSFFGGGARHLRGVILSLILVLACTASFAQQTGTGQKVR